VLASLCIALNTVLTKLCRESMMRAPLDLAEQQKEMGEDGLHGIKEEENDAGFRAIKHASYLKQHVNTFLAYRWMLQALMRHATGAAGGCRIQVADVVMFSEGEPTTWIYTNKLGYVDSRKFIGIGNDANMWPRFLKTARRAAGVSKDDL
jgi:hypothetical protein